MLTQTQMPITKTKSMQENFYKESAVFDPLEPSIIYDPATGCYFYRIWSVRKLIKLKSGIVISKDSNTGTNINISQAIKSGTLN